VKQEKGFEGSIYIPRVTTESMMSSVCSRCMVSDEERDFSFCQTKERGLGA
jgi:hypothetical protein